MIQKKLRCKIVRFIMLVPNCPGAQFYVFTMLVPNCPSFYLGAKLSICFLGAKLSVFTTACLKKNFLLWKLAVGNITADNEKSTIIFLDKYRWFILNSPLFWSLIELLGWPLCVTPGLFFEFTLLLVPRAKNFLCKSLIALAPLKFLKKGKKLFEPKVLNWTKKD